MSNLERKIIERYGPPVDRFGNKRKWAIIPILAVVGATLGVFIAIELRLSTVSTAVTGAVLAGILSLVGVLLWLKNSRRTTFARSADPHASFGKKKGWVAVPMMLGIGAGIGCFVSAEADLPLVTSVLQFTAIGAVGGVTIWVRDWWKSSAKSRVH